MARAELLAPKDRELVEAVFIRGQSTKSIARMTGVTPRVVRRQVAHLGRRLTGRGYMDTARALPYMTGPDARLARLRFCQGATHRQLCQRFGLTSHALRRRLDQVSAQIATIRRLDRSARRRSGAAWLEKDTSHQEHICVRETL